MPAISELPALSAVAPEDLLPVVDDPAGAPATKRASVADLLQLAWPVGSVFVSAVDTDPALLLGFGTWAAFGAGRVLVGLDATQAEFDTLGETGGAKAHALTVAELPAHTHAQDPHTHLQDAHNHAQNAHNHVQGVNSATTGGLSGYTPDVSTNNRVNSGYSTSDATATNQPATATNQPATATNQSTGGGQAHPSLMPYLVVRMWRRIA